MARLSRPLRGFGVLMPQWTPTYLDPTESSYTEADPRPGSAASDDVQVRAVPQVLGAQTEDVRFLGSSYAGAPGLGEEGGSVRWRTSGENDNDYRDWEPPIRVTGVHNFSGPLNDKHPSVCAFPLSGRVMVVWDSLSSGSVYNPHTASWSTITLPTTTDRWALAVIPGTERVLAVGMRLGITYRSDDYGASWEISAAHPPLWDPAVGSGYYRRVRAAFDGSGALLVVAERAGSTNVDFWVSSDLGCTWRLNATTSNNGADIYAHPDGSIICATLGASTGYVYVVRMGSAYDGLTLLDEVTLDGSNAHGEVTVGVDDDGVVWVYARPSSSSLNKWDAWYSLDGGLTYKGPIDGVFVYGSVSTGDYFYRPQVVFSSARACLVTGEDPGLASGWYACALWLGGWASQSYQSGGRLLVDRFVWGTDAAPTSMVWYSAGTPAAYSGAGWTDTTVGTGAIAMATPHAGLGGVEFYAPASGDSAYATQTKAHASGGLPPPETHYVEWSGVRTDAVTLAADPAVGVRLTTASVDYSIRVAADSFQVYDHDAGGTVGAPVALSGANVIVDFRVVYLDGGADEVVISWRETIPGQPEHTRWSSVTRTLAASGARADNFVVRFGIPGTNGSGLALRYRMFYFNAGVANGTAFTLPLTNGYGKPVGSDYPYPLPDVSDHENERLARFVMRGGPIFQGEVIEHDVAPGYPVEALFPTAEPSLSRAWRSTATGVVQDIAVDAGQGYATLPNATWSYLLCVRGANVRRVVLGGKTTGSYTNLGTLDLATGFTGLSFVRAGRMLVPGAGSAAGARYVRAGELVGGHVVLDPSGAPVRRRIRWNGPGWWADDSALPRLVLELEGVDGTEPGSGTVDLVWPSGVLVVHTSFASGQTHRYWRARIPSTEGSPDSYYTLPDVGLYALHVPGKEWGHGWEWVLDPNLRVDEDPYGTQRRTQQGPNRRTLTLSWDHGAKDDRVRGSSADYLGASGAAPLVAQDDVWGQLWGVWEASQGGAFPVVALMADVASGTTLTDPTLWLAGYLDGSLRVQESAGRGGEGVDSFYRAGPVRIVERV